MINALEFLYVFFNIKYQHNELGRNKIHFRIDVL